MFELLFWDPSVVQAISKPEPLFREGNCVAWPAVLEGYCPPQFLAVGVCGDEFGLFLFHFLASFLAPQGALSVGLPHSA